MRQLACIIFITKVTYCTFFEVLKYYVLNDCSAGGRVGAQTPRNT